MPSFQPKARLEVFQIVVVACNIHKMKLSEPCVSLSKFTDIRTYSLRRYSSQHPERHVTLIKVIKLQGEKNATSNWKLWRSIGQ